MMPLENRSVAALSSGNGITEQTLYTWRRQLKVQGIPVLANEENTEDWSSEDKFAIALETTTLNETDLAEYCRRRGLFMEQIPA
jgi:transposase-like protein